MTSLLWFRRDLRLRDLPALVAAHESAGAGGVLPLFVVDPGLMSAAGAPRVAALREALVALQGACDGAMVIRTGRPEDVVRAVAREARVTSVHVTGETTPYGRRRDDRVRASLPAGVPFVVTGSPYAVSPGRVLNRTGGPYQVFTPFSRAWRDHGWRRPAQLPVGLVWHRGVESEPAPDALGVEPARAPHRESGEDVALARWHAFLESRIDDYAAGRDRADLDGTSLMSTALSLGTVHPRTLLADVAALPGPRGAGRETFVTELCWREFYGDVLWHHPLSAWTDLRDGLGALAYDDPQSPLVDAWQQGRTGFPFVDAGMRQLLEEGWMHNRLRMVTASFLVKDLHVWWPHGARYFRAHLRDSDLASNSHGWQWVAGTGTDAAPYFRVFNPVAQGERFDPDGAYVRRYVPELRHLRGAAVHRPWSAPDGYAHGYPEPVVDHAEERAEALRRLAAARR